MQPLEQVPNRTQQVYHSVKESICDCTVKPGTHLVQEELAATLGVSRQPVQQAMLLLKNDGLVVERGGRGLFVAPLDRDSMVHHYQIRRAIDQLAAKLVAEKAAKDESFRAELRTVGQGILSQGAREACEGSAAAAVRHDVAFHSMIYQFTGNPFIGPTLDSHWMFQRRVMIGVLQHASQGPLVWSQHEDILASLLSGDADAAVALATEHLVCAQQSLLDLLESDAFAALFGTFDDN